MSRSLRILDFDCEARPLSWYGGDWVTKEVTAIAWAWVGEEHQQVYSSMLTRDEGSAERMLIRFLEFYREADVVTGHFIRGYDLPVLNGDMIELGMLPLPDKMTVDTKLDLLKFTGLSKSQENLGAMLGLHAPKIDMTQADWRNANRLTESGIAKTRERVVGDVVQHMEMYRRLVLSGWLGPAKLWSSSAQKSAGYQP